MPQTLCSRQGDRLSCDGQLGGWGRVVVSERRLPGQAECEGVLGVIRDSSPAITIRLGRLSGELELRSDRPNGLFLFAEILRLSGAPDSGRFVPTHRDGFFRFSV